MGLQRRGRAVLSLNARQIGELVAELAPLLSGAELRDVHPLPPRDLLLVFAECDDPARVLRLRLAADPDASRLHLQHGRVRRSAGGPLCPFFRRLIDELPGRSLRRLQQVRGDRLVLLEFSGGGERRALLAELTGRHANLLLLGPRDELVDLLVPAPSRKGDPRLIVGRPWRAPPGSPPIEKSLATVAQALPAVAEAALPERAPLSWLVEAHFLPQVAERERDRARRTLVRRIERKLDRARSLARGLARRVAACETAERVRQDGELLLAHLARLRRGLDSVELEDLYSDGSPSRRIPLDPRLDPQGNAQRFFDRARKLERSRAELPEEVTRVEQRIADLEELRARAEDTCEDAAALDAVGVEAGLLDAPQQADPRKRPPPAPRLPYRTFTGCAGSEIRVGRSARDNDALTFRHCRGNDLWLHTAEAPGSHVVLRTARGVEPDPEEVLDAAHLAVHFSPLRGAGRADIHVARRKQVHKPRGAPAGLVTLSGGRNLAVRVQPHRLERLLSPDRTAKD
ncbi:MAG: NFACT family protein [Planctomycetota bacterium]|nr:NFACT family protein [Planctomycetota bacterium]